MPRLDAAFAQSPTEIHFSPVEDCREVDEAFGVTPYDAPVFFDADGEVFDFDECVGFARLELFTVRSGGFSRGKRGLELFLVQFHGALDPHEQRRENRQQRIRLLRSEMLIVSASPHGVRLCTKPAAG